MVTMSRSIGRTLLYLSVISAVALLVHSGCANLERDLPQDAGVSTPDPQPPVKPPTKPPAVVYPDDPEQPAPDAGVPPDATQPMTPDVAA